MYVVATFDHSIYLELAVTAIQMKGIPKDSILSVPLDKRGEERRLMDSIHHSDGLSTFDLSVIIGAMATLFCSIYGFVLPGGPVLWGLIGLAGGMGIGGAIKWVVTARYNNRQRGKKASEVVLIIACGENQVDMVKDTLWENLALGVRKLSLK